MNLKNVKAVRLCGVKYDVERAVNVDKLEGDNDGCYNTTAGKIYIKAGLQADRESFTIWHEIGHALDFQLKIKDGGSEMTETETQRLAAGMQGLEIEYNETQPKENYSTWYLLGEKQPADGTICIIKRGEFQCAKYEVTGKRFVLENKEIIPSLNSTVLWTVFTQDLWDILCKGYPAVSPI